MNARDVKNVPGRPKTDKLDAIWLAKLTARGMLRPTIAIHHHQLLVCCAFSFATSRRRGCRRAPDGTNPGAASALLSL